jgi:L-asparaginase II
MIKDRNLFPMIEVLRNNNLESLHFGSVVVMGPGNKPIFECGDTDKLIYPRSAMKMIQAIPLLDSGAIKSYRLGPKQIALACSSHQGSVAHTSIIKKWLTDLGLTEKNLRCGIQPPSDKLDRQELRERGEKPTQLTNNCSGKHAGFLTYSKYHKLSFEYDHLDHHIQKEIQKVLEELSGENIVKYGIDGCSAPNFMISLRGLGSAMFNLADTKNLGKIRSKSIGIILDSMHNFPNLVAGNGRACTEFMLAADSLTIVKTGAEGVFVAVIPEKRIGVALKILDGSTRAAEAAIALILVRLGVLNKNHPAVIKRLFREIRNWNGKLTGSISPTDRFWDFGKKLI